MVEGSSFQGTPRDLVCVGTASKVADVLGAIITHTLAQPL